MSGGRGRFSTANSFGLIAGPFMTMVDSAVVNVALPVMVVDFHSTLSSVQWVLSGYLLALGAVLVSSAYLSKRFGAHRVYLVSIMGFTGASALCAISPSLEFLIVARVAQGALGALLVPLAMDMLLGKGGAANQISPAFGAVLFLAPALGPTLGGALIGVAGWQSVFLVNVPIGLVSAYLVRRGMKFQSVKHNDVPGFDLIGSATLATGIVLVLYGSTEGTLVGWTSASSLSFWVSGGVLVVGYGLWAIRSSHPAVNLKLLRDPQSALAFGISNIANIVLFAILVLLPVFMESVQGVSALVTGLTLLPQGLVTGLGILVGNKMIKTKSVRFITLLGFLMLTVTTALLLTVGLATPLWVIAFILSGRGLALGFTIQPLLYATVGRLAGNEVPDGNTLFNVMERVFGSAGISLLTTFFQSSVQSHLSQSTSLGQASVQAFSSTVAVLVVISLVGLALSALLSKTSTFKDSAPSSLGL